MQFIRPLLVALIAAGIAIPVLSQTSTMNPMNTMNPMKTMQKIDVTMGQLNGSNQDGTATVTDVKGGVNVVVSLKNAPSGASEPAHIHTGTCAKLNPAPYKPLKNIVDGTSTTTISGLSVADLKKAKYAINVHDASNPSRYVSCGDLSSS